MFRASAAALKLVEQERQMRRNKEAALLNAKSEIAELKAQLAEAKAALGWALKQLDDLEDFHDSDTKPCCEYGAECPISMGEWFDDDDRGKLKKAHATLAKLEQNENGT